MEQVKIPEFGLKRENEERRDGGCGVVFDPVTQRYAVGRQTTDGFYACFPEVLMREKIWSGAFCVR